MPGLRVPWNSTHRLVEDDHSALPGAKTGRFMRRQRIFNALMYRNAEEIIRRRDHDRHALGRANRALLGLDTSFAGSIRVERDQLNGVDVERRAKDNCGFFAARKPDRRFAPYTVNEEMLNIRDQPTVVRVGYNDDVEEELTVIGAKALHLRQEAARGMAEASAVMADTAGAEASISDPAPERRPG
jgi:hypothetical protein